MTYRLPPLKTLRLFEAAGRHGSFKKAAEELSLTPSAVSHGIQALEDWLGASLFIRSVGAITLTAAGKAYLPYIAQALETIARGTEVVPGRRRTGRLVVSVAPSFGMRWLAPKIPQFAAKHPNIEVSLDTSARQVDFARDGVDAAIRLGKGDWPELIAKLLLREWLVPVCSPDVADRIKNQGDINGITLLHVMSVSEDWETWKRLSGHRLGEGNPSQKFDNMTMAYEAAAGGMGIAIGRLSLVQDDLSARRLVQVLAPPVQGESGYWFVTTRENIQRAEVIAFRKWILAELEKNSTAQLVQASAAPRH